MDTESRRWTTFALSAIVLAGLGLRVWYAVEALRIDRFRDERYSLENVRSIVDEGTLEPANYYYPSPFFNLPPALLLKSSEALHQRTGNPAFETITAGGYGAATFLLVRLLQVAYGCLGIALTFLVGQTVFSREVGLLGALALAFMPWHIHASGYFKPDVELATLTLLAFYVSMKAVERPAVKTCLLAAVAVALAASTKLLGALVAVPLAVGTMASGWRDRRRLGLLLLSGVAGVVVFALINPYWRRYPGWLHGVESDYAMRAARQGMTRSQIPGRVVDLIADSYVLGPLLGLLGLGAAVVLAIRWIRPRRPKGRRPEKTRHLMFLVFPIAYIAAYAWRTPYFKANNFLPLLPFFALASAWALVEVWRRAESSWPALTSAWARGLGLLALLVVLGWPGLAYTYRATTPTTLDKALAFLGRRTRPAEGRLFLVEEVPLKQPVWEGRRTFGGGRSRVEWVDDWRQVSDRRRAAADGVIVALKDGEPSWLGRVPPRNVRVFEARHFRLRGPPVAAANHGWQRVGDPVWLPLSRCRPRTRCFAAVLPVQLEPVTRLSFAVNVGLARGERVVEPLELRVGGQAVPLLAATRTEREAVYVTEKLTPPHGEATVVFIAEQRFKRPQRVGIQLHRWTGAESLEPVGRRR